MSATFSLADASPPAFDAADRRWRQGLDTALGWLAVAIGFSIPVSTSLSEILTTVFMVCWLLAGNLTARWRQFAQNPIALGSLGMFVWLVVGMTYSTASWSEASRCLLKYREFVYLPLLATVFAADERLRRAGLHSFFAGTLAVLAMSYGEWLIGFDVGLPSSVCDYVVAKDRIIHSLLMTLLIYLSAQELIRFPARKWWYAAVIALAVANVLFMVQGRTGYVLLGLLTVLMLAQQFGWRGFVAACVVVGMGAGGAYSASASVQARVAQTIKQLRHHFSGFPKEKMWDPRLEYYNTTLALVVQHPYFGTGTGSFTGQYDQAAATREIERTTDPHNEYLHIAAQLGVPGVLGFVLLLCGQWRLSRRLPLWDGRLARGIVLAIAAGSLFNSLILSITGGLAFGYFGGLAFAELSKIAPAESVDSDVTGPSERSSVRAGEMRPAA